MYSGFVGTYSIRGSEGIYRVSADLESGEGRVEVAARALSPAYLWLDETEEFLYSLVETRELDGWHGGGVSSFKIGAERGLTALDTQRTFGAIPCFVSATRSGQVLVANCHDGSASVFDVSAGSIGARQQVISHYALRRDRRSHVHCAVASPDERWIVLVDTGLDEIVAYEAGRAGGGLVLAELPVESKPRHLWWSPDGRFAYVCTEGTSRLHGYRWSDGGGVPRLEEIQVCSSLPPGYEGPRTSCGAVRVSPSGRSVVVSNRGAESVAVFGRDLSDGAVELLEVVELEGACPRDVSFSADGALAAVCLEYSDIVAFYPVDVMTGSWGERALQVKIPSPSCMQFTSRVFAE